MTNFVTSFTPGTARSNFSGCVGYKFTIGGADITVNYLGRWKIAGNSQSHTVRIMSGANTTLASAAVDMSGGSAGSFVYAAISPLVLSAGVAYYIFSSETSSGDQFYDSDTSSIVVDSMASVAGSYYEITCGSDVNLDTGGNHAYGVPTFSTDAPAATFNPGWATGATKVIGGVF